MFVSISKIDLVEILNLDKSMSVGEIDIILENLSKETYFRFLFEELPKLLKGIKNGRNLYSKGRRILQYKFAKIIQIVRR